METKKVDLGIRGKAIGFLVWFRNQYKNGTEDTFYKMAEKYGQCNYGTCRNLIIELGEAGYIKRSDGMRKRKFYIDKLKYNTLMNPFILNKHDSRSEKSAKSED